MIDEVPKHRKKGGKKPLSSLSTKHLLDLAKAKHMDLAESVARLIRRGLPDNTWVKRANSTDMRWFAEFYHDVVETNCDKLNLLLGEIEGRMNEY